MAAMRAFDMDMGEAPVILDLGDRRATDPSVAGAKAANLARAREQGFPILPGFVVATSAGVSSLRDAGFRIELGRRWASLTAGGEHPIVVRSSSVAEDGAESSMAGMFRSITNVATWKAFLIAVEEVQASAAIPLVDSVAAMAVLVQLHLEPTAGGVLFGIDPLSGRRDRMVVAAVNGSPEALVSGRVEGDRLAITRRGRVVEHLPAADPIHLTPGDRRRLAAMGRRAEATFGGPQDIEWAKDRQGRLWMLQSRSVTAVGGASTRATGPVLGPGPVAETFPDPLSSLERDLWLEPFREGIAAALSIAGIHSRKRIARSPVAMAVGGRAAVDLELLGALPKPRSWAARLDPRPPSRRLAAGWRVGRLRAAIPALSGDLIERVEGELAAVGSLDRHDVTDLIALLDRTRAMLVSLHGHEALAGMVMTAGADGASGAAAALRALSEARRTGLAEHEIAAAYPEVLSLYPPAIGSAPSLPDSAAEPPPLGDSGGDISAARERLRLEIRLVHELSARTAFELGRRAREAGTLRQPDEVRRLKLDEVEAVASGRVNVLETALPPSEDEPPLPVAFRLTASGAVVPEKGTAPPSGQGAGGGRAIGVVRNHRDEVLPGDVLVVRTLDPQLAGTLPMLGGLVAETGSILSHLAILAREFDVPTVVGAFGALDRFPAGSKVVVDGIRGEIALVPS